jgi:hypothetical protein
MYIQNGGNLGHAEFDDYEKAYEAMKVMTARHIGVATDMLGSMMDSNGEGPFFYVHRDSAFVDSSSGAGSLSMDDTIIVKVGLKNTSDVAGKETVQIYANDKASSYITPAKSLVGYKKVEVKPGSEAVAVVEIPASRLAFYDKYGKLTLEPGDFEIMACSNASDVHFTQTVTVQGAKAAAKSETVSNADETIAATVISIEIMARDIQATVIEGVKIIVDGKVAAVTSADGSCSAQIPAGARVRFTKEGYETIEKTVAASGRIDLTMTPSF